MLTIERGGEQLIVVARMEQFLGETEENGSPKGQIAQEPT
jgi:hypothetical protein